MMNYYDDPAYISLTLARKLVRRGVDTIRDAVAAGEIDGAVTPHRVYVRRQSLFAWAARTTAHHVVARELPVGATTDDVVAAVAAACDVPVAEVRSRSRTSAASRARQIAIAAFLVAGWTKADASVYFARDHATICHALAQVKKRDDWQAIADTCGNGGVRPSPPPSSEPTVYPRRPAAVVTENLRAGLAHYDAATTSAVLSYVRCTLLAHTRAQSTLCARGLMLLARDDRLYATVVDRLTRSGYGADAARIEGQIERLGWRRTA